jgi:hypothetical protein
MSTDRNVSPKNSLHIRAPSLLTSAIRDAAARQMTTKSEYARRALIEKLRSDGVDLARLRAGGDERRVALQPTPEPERPI